MPRTSNTDPIDVDWLPIPTPGRIGITLAPGKQSLSYSGAAWQRDLATDLDHLVGHHEVRALACLLEDHEFAALKIPAYLAEARKRSIEVIRLPIPDGGTPSAMSPLLELVADIRERAARGANVVIHCAAGLGRSGVVGGSVLIAGGMSAPEAIATLHRVRSPNSPESTSQEEYLASVERFCHRQPNFPPVSE